MRGPEDDAHTACFETQTRSSGNVFEGCRVPFQSRGWAASDRTRRGVFSVQDVLQSRSSCIHVFWADVLPRRGIDIRKLKRSKV